MVRKMVESGDEGGGGRNFFDIPTYCFAIIIIILIMISVLNYKTVFSSLTYSEFQKFDKTENLSAVFP